MGFSGWPIRLFISFLVLSVSELFVIKLELIRNVLSSSMTAIAHVTVSWKSFSQENHSRASHENLFYWSKLRYIWTSVWILKYLYLWKFSKLTPSRSKFMRHAWKNPPNVTFVPLLKKKKNQNCGASSATRVSQTRLHGLTPRFMMFMGSILSP